MHERMNLKSFIREGHFGSDYQTTSVDYFNTLNSTNPFISEHSAIMFRKELNSIKWNNSIAICDEENCNILKPIKPVLLNQMSVHCAVFIPHINRKIRRKGEFGYT